MNIASNWLVWVALFILAMYIGRCIMYFNGPRTSSHHSKGTLTVRYKGMKLVVTTGEGSEVIDYISDGDKEYVTISVKDYKELERTVIVQSCFSDHEDASDWVKLLFTFNTGQNDFVRFDPVNARGLMEAQLKLWCLCIKNQ